MIYWVDPKRLQSQRNAIEDNNDIKLLLIHIKNLQNIAKVEILRNNKTAQSIKNTVCRKRVDVSIRKIISTTN